MKKAIILVSALCLIGCITTQKQNKTSTVVPRKAKPVFFQYNIWGAFVNRVFDGSLTVKELKSKGDIGLGSFDFLDGEMVMLDGVAYRITEDGKVTQGNSEDQIVYADATFFHPESVSSCSESVNFDGLRKWLNTAIPSPNNFYAFKIKGEFDDIKLGGLHKQTPPFTTGLDVLIPSRPIFTGKKIKGTMIGFYCPSFIGDINAAGYHFHFISDDKKLGGHVMEMTSSQTLNVAMQKIINYEFKLPESIEFQNVQFDKQFQYNKK